MAIFLVGLNGVPDDLDGGRAAAVGSIAQGAARDLGASPFFILFPEIPEALQDGIVDVFITTIRDQADEIARAVGSFVETLDPADATPTDGPDGFAGGEGADIVSLLGGGDRYEGLWGNDVIYGNGGADRLFGNMGADRLFGGRGDDGLAGGRGADQLDGGAGQDLLLGGAGRDLLRGGDDRDLLLGETGNDTLLGNRGADTLRGGDGFDALAGGFGADELHGGAKADTLDGGRGNDTLTGGRGQDVFVFRAQNQTPNHDEITDFDPARDQLQISDGSYTLRPVGPDTVIFYNNQVDSLTLRDINDLDAVRDAITVLDVW